MWLQSLRCLLVDMADVCKNAIGLLVYADELRRARSAPLQISSFELCAGSFIVAPNRREAFEEGLFLVVFTFR